MRTPDQPIPDRFRDDPRRRVPLLPGLDARLPGRLNQGKGSFPFTSRTIVRVAEGMKATQPKKARIASDTLPSATALVPIHAPEGSTRGEKPPRRDGLPHPLPCCSCGRVADPGSCLPSAEQEAVHRKSGEQDRRKVQVSSDAHDRERDRSQGEDDGHPPVGPVSIHHRGLSVAPAPQSEH
jgi:hypothetical protein